MYVYCDTFHILQLVPTGFCFCTYCHPPVPIQTIATCRTVSGLLFYFALCSAFWLLCDVGALAFIVTKSVMRLPLVSYVLVCIVGWGELEGCM